MTDNHNFKHGVYFSSATLHKRGKHAVLYSVLFDEFFQYYPMNIYSYSGIIRYAWDLAICNLSRTIWLSPGLLIAFSTL